MDNMICENCGYEDNISGQISCSMCGHELYYVDEDTDFKQEDLVGALSEYEKKEIEIEKSDLFWEKIKNCKLTTGFTFEGYKIIDYIDVVFEESLVGIGIKTTFQSFNVNDAFASLTGSEHTAVTKRIQEVKQSVREKLIKKSVEIGGNAIIGIDFESTYISNSMIMVSMSGTVVNIEKTE